LRELQAYNAELLDKPRILAITKCDLIDDEFIALIESEIQSLDIPRVYVSGVSGLGLDKLKDMLWKYIDRQRSQESFD
jgi:GTP-binding protein